MSDKGFWWCPECQEEVDSSRVTNEECHDSCGQPVIWVEMNIAPKSERRIRSCFSVSQGKRCIHCDDSSECCQIADMVGDIYWKRNSALYDSDEEPSEELDQKVASQIPCDWHIFDSELKAVMEALP